MRGKQPACLRVGVRGDDVDAYHRVRALELARGLETLAINGQRGHQQLRGEMRGEGEWQAEGCGQLGTEQTRAQQPDRHRQPGAGYRAGQLACRRLEIALQLLHVLRKLVGAARQIPPQRACRDRIGARSPAESQVDPVRVQRGQRAELLGDHQRRVIGQHHASGADADAARAGHVVMLGDPEPPEAQGFGMARELQGIAQRIGRARPFDDR